MEKYSREVLDFFESMQGAEKTASERLVSLNPREHVREIAVSPTITGLMKSATIPEDIHPLKLRDLLLEVCGSDWLDWLPEVADKTLFGEIPGPILDNKIQAVRVSLTTDSPWLEWNIFENVGTSFNHQVPSFAVMQPLSVGECLTTMNTLHEIRPEEEFSSEVLSYVASIAFNNNFVYLPKDMVIGLADPYLRKMIYDKELADRVAAVWEKLKNKEILTAQFSEDNPVHRQLAKLAFINQYLREFEA